MKLRSDGSSVCVVKWIGSRIRPKARDRRDENRVYYNAFAYGDVEVKVGDHVLIQNFDALDTDSEENCDVAKILKVYESADNDEPFRAVVQWYTRSHLLPKKYRSHKMPFPQFHVSNEVLEDQRNFENDVNIESIFKKCQVIQAMPEEDPNDVLNNYTYSLSIFVVRFQFLRHKGKQGFEILPIVDLDLACIVDDSDGHGENLSHQRGEEISATKGSNQDDHYNSGSSKCSTDSGVSRSSSKRKGKSDLKKIKSAEKISTSSDYSRCSRLYNESKTVKRKLEESYDSGEKKKDLIMSVKDRDITELLQEESDSDVSSEDGSVSGKDDVGSSMMISNISELVVKLERIPSATKIEKNGIGNENSTIKFTPKKAKLKTVNKSESLNDEYRKSCSFKKQESLESPSRYVRNKKISSGSPLPKDHRDVRSEIPLKVGSKSKNCKPSALEEVRSRLHVSSIPNCLPCREQEFTSIYSFVEDKILDGAGGCMYICGVPGTGKTATVREVVRQLQVASMKGKIPTFEYGEVNGMKVTEPRKAYSEVLRVLTGREGVSSEEACELLDQRFSRPAPRRLPTLLLIDELDLLWTKRQDVVYNLMDWPNRDRSRLVVITIANTMDLPERILMGRVSSRLGLTRLTFHPYTFQQLQEIVMSRMKGLEAFDPDAVQLVARKVAAVSGDARRALDICRRATEIAESEGLHNNIINKSGSKSKTPKKVAKLIVSMAHVDQALSEMISSSKAKAIQSCSRLQKLFLQAVATEVERTGVEETSFERVHSVFSTLCTYNGLRRPTITETMNICWYLGSLRLILTEENSHSDILQRIMLNVDVDSVHYSLKVIN